MKKILLFMLSIALLFPTMIFAIEESQEDVQSLTQINVNTTEWTIDFKELKQVAATNKTITLSWNKYEGASGYLIQVKSGKKWKTVSTIKKNSIVTAKIKKLKAGTKYTYKVVAYKNVKKKKKTVKETLATTDSIIAITSPATPKASIKGSSFNSIKVGFNKQKGSSKYVLVRSTSKKGKYEEVAVINGTYTDTNLKTGQTYYYKIKACNSNDYCSGFSKVVSKKTSLAKPSLKVKSEYKGTVSISTKAVSGEDGYEIEYSKNAKKGFKKVVELDISKSSYLHENSSLKSKKTYYYRLRAYRLVDGKKVYSSYSKVQKVKISNKVLEKLKSISLNVSDKIAVNTSKNIVVSFNPSNKSEDITWTSSNEDIAQVVDGKVTGKSLGNAKITATSKSGITNSVTVSIYKPAENLELSETNIEIYLGESANLLATITPDDATYRTVNYKSSNNSVATVNNNGVISAISVGRAKIVVSTEEGISKECIVIVKEKPLEFSGTGDQIITNINIPEGEYVANITINSDDYNSVKFYYGSEEYDYELLVNDTDDYSGTTLLKGGSIDAVSNGILEIKTEGSWTIEIERLVKEELFPMNGLNDTVTGIFDGIGVNEVFEISFDSDSYHGVKIYKYDEDDYDLLVNEVFESYHGDVMTKTLKGEKYFFTVETEGNWSIKRKRIEPSVSFPINGNGPSVSGLFEGTGNREIFNVSFDSDSYHGLEIYEYGGGYFDSDLLVNEAGEPYSSQVLALTEKGKKYFFVVDTDGTWSISR